MHRSVSVILAAFVATALTMGASAADRAATVTVGKTSVYYGDLDLASQTGAAVLQQRISTAAAMVCGGAPQFATSYRGAPKFTTAEFERCRTVAAHTAIEDVRRARVAIAY